MKILIFSVHPENDNRISKHISTLIKNNYSVKYINTSYSKSKKKIARGFIYKHFNIECHPKKNILVYCIILLYFLFQLIINLKYKHIHIHDNYLLPLTPFAKIFRMKVYYDKHEYYEKVNKVYYLYEKIFSVFIDKYVLVTEGQIDFVIKAKKQYILVPNYQSKNYYSKINEDKNKIFTITYLGSLMPYDRDIDSMLYIFSKLSSNIRIVFGGRYLPKEYYAVIEDIKKQNMNFIFKENLDYEEVAYYTKNSDVCLFLLCPDITKEISANKVYENLICNNLLIAYSGNKTIDKLAEEGVVKTFDREDNDKIVEFIFLLLHNPEILLEYRNKCKKVSDMYTWESIEDRYVNLYK